MGTHVKSPSGVVDRKQNLAQILTENPDLIGDQVSRRFDTTNGNLPFLFKVLAIGKALSVQTHPDKKTSEKLHAEQPTVYTGEIFVDAALESSRISCAKIRTTSLRWPWH